MKKYYPMVPQIFSGAGACLTPENWQEVGISMVSCSLQALLFKPGIDALFQIKDLKKHLGWSGKLVLNANMPAARKDDSYAVFSPYDGSRITITPEVIRHLTKHLQADYVILPIEMEVNHNNQYPFEETNQPADDAANGIVYTQNGNFDITTDDMAMQFDRIDSDCTCPTCKKSFTRAYLHHLLANTPLLAQRLLIMHNVYYLVNNKKTIKNQ